MTGTIWLKTIASSISPRCLAPILGLIIFLYILIYLLWTSPISHTVSRHPKNFVNGNLKQSKKLAESDSRESGYNRGEPMIIHPQAQHGKGVWIPDRKIQVISAIHDIHHAQGKDTEVRVVLPSFLQHSSNRDFFCCFHWSDNLSEFVQVPAQLDYIDLRYMTELQNAAFECIIKGAETANLHKIGYVSFAPKTCGRSPTLPMKIFTPVKRKFEFAICTKVAYGRLDPQRLLEWFSFMEVMGASKIVTFFNNVHQDSKKIFDYFVQKGLLELIEYDPRNYDGESVMYNEANAQTRQAQHDKTLVVRDCQYRLGGYDFVMTIDFDEMPVPERPVGSMNWVFQILSRNHSDAAAFYFDPILLTPEWQSRHDPVLHHWQFTKGANIAPYCTKWAYVPARTWMASTHEVLPKEGYSTYGVPRELLHFLHFRTCKREWAKINCTTLIQETFSEISLLRFADRVIDRLRRLPLLDLLPKDSRSGTFAHLIKSDKRANGSKFEPSIFLSHDKA